MFKDAALQAAATRPCEEAKPFLIITIARAAERTLIPFALIAAQLGRALVGRREDAALIVEARMHTCATPHDRILHEVVPPFFIPIVEV
jgi:hypothetical protein